MKRLSAVLFLLCAQCGIDEAPDPEEEVAALDSTAVPVIVARTNVVASLATGAQTDADLAIDPTDAPYYNHLIGVSDDAATSRISVYETDNGGTTWRTHKLVTPSGSFTGVTRQGSAAYSADGNGVVSFLVYDSSGTSNRIAVSRRAAGASAFSRPVVVTSSTADRQRIAIDRSTASSRVNTVYLAFTDGQRVMVAASTNGGASFGTPVRVDDGGGSATSPYPMVARDGTVYVAWLDVARGQLRIDRSTNGGASWGTDHVIHALSAAGAVASTPAAPQKGARLAPFCDVDRSTGTYRGAIYCTYTDRTSTNGLDVFLRRSTDGGATWSAARRMNDDPAGVAADQFLPRVQIDDGSGKVNIAWYDTRDDAAHRKTNVYFTRANDGWTYAPSVRVTRAASDESRAGASPENYGETLGLESWKGRARVLWTDSRSGDEEIYSCILDFGHPNLVLGGSGTLDMPRGGSDTLSVTVTASNGFVSPVTLSLSNLPSGATASFSVNPVPVNGTSVLTVKAGTAAAGSRTLTLRAAGGGESASRSVPLTIY